VTVPGRSIAVTGQLRPYVPGVRVQVRAYLNGKLFKRRSVGLKRAASGRYESYATTIAAPRNGTVKVLVSRARDRKLTGVRADASFAALDDDVTFNSTGPFVKLLQQRLAALHFYIPQTGVYDTGTGNAIDAYRRLIGLGPAQTIDPEFVTHLLNGDGSFHVRFPDQGRHAEGDLSDQLLALIDGSHVQLIFPISSGKPSTPTILGSYQVYLREPGYLSDGMYYSDFFISGYAIHGYDPAPDYPASHGCMRLPIPDAITAYNWLGLGDWVDTYYT
jgi:L,D-transpeptidase catalytic domain